MFSRFIHRLSDFSNVKHLLTDCMVNAKKYSDCSSDVQTERSEIHMKS